MEENMNNRKIIKILLAVLCFVAAGILFTYLTKKPPAEPAQGALSTETETLSEEESTSETAANVCVHVCGSVIHPGVYYLEEGARIHEAVELAGGMTEHAAGDVINLAEVVCDGEKIYIPSKEELAEGFSIEDPQNADDGLVNINTASLDELKKLPGIGDIKAEAIIAYREETGRFNSIEDIMNVSGIKDSSYEQIKDYIKV